MMAIIHPLFSSCGYACRVKPRLDVPAKRYTRFPMLLWVRQRGYL
jgi:hypothetical protein